MKRIVIVPRHNHFLRSHNQQWPIHHQKQYHNDISNGKKVVSALDFNDTKSLYAKSSTRELLQSYLMLSSCRHPLIKNHGARMLELGGDAARFFARHTYFRHFCGGENLNDTRTVIEGNYRKGLCTVLDYSVESAPVGVVANGGQQQQDLQDGVDRLKHAMASAAASASSSKSSSSASSSSANSHHMEMMEQQMKMMTGAAGRGGAMSSELTSWTDEQKQDEIARMKANSITFMSYQNQVLLGQAQVKQQGASTATDVTRHVLPCPFGVVKMTAISDSDLLLKWSEILNYVAHFPDSAHAKRLLESHFEIFDDYGSRVPYDDHQSITAENNSNSIHYSNLSLILQEYAKRGLKRSNSFPSLKQDTPPEELPDRALDQMRRVIDRLQDICEECDRSGIALLIDAEQTYLQPVIDLLTMFMTLKYNVFEPGKRPMVHNTYQLYLKDTLDRLKIDNEFIQEYGQGRVKQGAKLVRGAYIKSESARCAELDLPNPFNAGIEATHKTYHLGIDFVLEQLTRDDSVAVVFASHNPNSVLYASHALDQWGVDKRDDRIMFAQLYGMGDSLSLALANGGYNAAKLVPYGPVGDVLPYLSRRLIENSDILGGSAIETQRMKQEIIARLFQKR